MKKLLLAICACALINAQDFRLAAGAGYKAPLVQAIKHIESELKISPEASYANLAQVIALAKANDYGIVVGDKKFFDAKGLKGVEEITLGKGVLMGISNSQIKSADDILKAKKIAIPSSSKAIYGIAATEFFKNANLENQLKDKVLEVSNVPQVGVYVANKDVDLGFVNLTEVLAKKDLYKHSFRIDEKYYTPIRIVALRLPSCKDSCVEFYNALKSQEVKKIFTSFGLE